MTITVPIMQVGILRATEIVHDARNAAARRHETEPRIVSVEVDPSRATEDRATEDHALPGQRRVVDLRV